MKFNTTLEHVPCPKFRLLPVLTLLVVYSSLVIAQSGSSNSNSNRNANTGVSTNANLNNKTTDNTGSSSAANVNSNSDAGVSKTPPCPAPNAAPAQVKDVYKEINTQPVSAGSLNTSPATAVYASKVRDVELGDVIVVEGDNFQTLLAQAACEKKNVVLYLDDRPFKDVTAYPPTDPSKPTLRFTLKRTEDSRDVWTYVLGKPGWGTRPTKVSIGIVDRFPIESNAIVNLKVIPHGWFYFWVCLFVLILIGFLILAYKSNLLRDPVPSPGEGQKRPYSLARTQIAWWFFLVLASYLLIGIITGDFSTTINSTVLILLGISSGTAVASAMVDTSKSTPESSATQTASTQAVQARVTQLDTAIDAANANIIANANDVAAKQTLASSQQEKQERASQLKKLKNQSENFLIDILSDANGVSFHRFQMAAWTLILGIVFVFGVYNVLAMPEFNSTLLTLLGISAGTYVGLKIPEPTVPGT
jgi:hypothetical protein